MKKFWVLTGINLLFFFILGCYCGYVLKVTLTNLIVIAVLACCINVTSYFKGRESFTIELKKKINFLNQGPGECNNEKRWR